jgi:hypothetical protein
MSVLRLPEWQKPRRDTLLEPVGQYYIFRRDGENRPILVETAASLDDARGRVQELTTMLPDDYFIFDQENGCFVVPGEAARSMAAD